MRGFQHLAVDHIVDNPYCALWMEMGLGKTVSTLTALLKLKDDFEVGNVLVAAPLRVARKTWTDEIDTWSHTHGLTVAKILGNAEQRRAGMKAQADIHVINRENVSWLIDHYDIQGREIQPWPWDTVVLDESSSYRSQSSGRWKAMRRICKHVDRMVQLTGTPAPKGLINLWAQLYLLDQGARLGSTITSYRDRWFEFNPYQHMYKPRNFAETEILERCKDLCLTLREEDYLDLPPVTYNRIPVELSASERKTYRQMEDRYVIELRSKLGKNRRITAVNAGVLAGKLLQLANGHVYHNHPDWVAFHEHKLNALIEILEQLDGPVMVCYNYRPDLIRLRERLSKAGVNYDVLDTSASERKWNRGETDVLLLHPASAGHGLNLHHSGSETVIWFGLNWDLELYQQANARLAGGHRREGKHIVVHHIITEGTQDDVVMDNLNDKEQGQERILNAMKRKLQGAKL